MAKMRIASFVLAVVSAPLLAQTSPEIQQILERLAKLEEENRALRQEVESLKASLPAPPEPGQPTARERLDVQERRVEELAQVKVEATQKFPIRLTGMALMNAFLNGRANGGSDYPTTASRGIGGARGGATFRQSIIGLEFNGPRLFGGGTVHGSLFTDFFGGGSAPLAANPRIRTASIVLDWDRTSLTLGQEKPIVSPREPTSLAQVGLSPLTGAGNLWLWEPQVRLDHRFDFGPQTSLTAQLGVVQTTESGANVPPAFAASVERYRPGYEARFMASHSFGESGRIEIAPSAHASTTHVAATSVPSRLWSVDWLIAPAGKVELTGMFFTGKNVAHFGVAGIRQGFTVLAPGEARPIASRGGWSQLLLRATPQLDFHLMAGIHDDRNGDLEGDGVGRNFNWGGNFFYRLAPNVIFSVEAMQARTAYLQTGRRVNNHFDLAIAYLF